MSKLLNTNQHRTAAIIQWSFNNLDTAPRVYYTLPPTHFSSQMIQVPSIVTF